ncbi:MAG: hypothetical protein KH135_01685 [Firmicutes bacterium]|nr:hypothetical protein [Bacillota bacterium]
MTKKKKEKIKIENARSMKISAIIILVIALLYLISPEKQKEQMNEVLPNTNPELNTAKKITLTDTVKKEYEDWIKGNNLALSAITTVTTKEVTDENKLKFILIKLKNSHPEQTYPLEEGSNYTCVSKEIVTPMLSDYFVNAFSDASIPNYEKEEEEGPVKTDTAYCYVVKDNYGITLPTTLKSITLNEKTNIYTVTYTSNAGTSIFTIQLKNANGKKLIQAMSFI